MIKLKKIELVYPGIYVKRGSPFDNKLSYQTGFIYDGDELTKEGISRGKSELEVYNAKSTVQTAVRPIEQTLYNYQKIAEHISLAQNCNIPLDNVFKGMIVDAVIDIYEYHHGDRQGKGIYLKEIFVNQDDLLSNILMTSTGEIN